MTIGTSTLCLFLLHIAKKMVYNLYHLERLYIVQMIRLLNNLGSEC